MHACLCTFVCAHVFRNLTEFALSMQLVGQEREEEKRQKKKPGGGAATKPESKVRLCTHLSRHLPTDQYYSNTSNAIHIKLRVNSSTQQQYRCGWGDGTSLIIMRSWDHHTGATGVRMNKFPIAARASVHRHLISDIHIMSLASLLPKCPFSTEIFPLNYELFC